MTPALNIFRHLLQSMSNLEQIFDFLKTRIISHTMYRPRGVLLKFGVHEAPVAAPAPAILMSREFQHITRPGSLNRNFPFEIAYAALGPYRISLTAFIFLYSALRPGAKAKHGILRRRQNEQPIRGWTMTIK